MRRSSIQPVRSLVSACVLLALAAVAQASSDGMVIEQKYGGAGSSAVRLTMDLPDPQVVDGLWMEGVRFSYQQGGLPSLDAGVPTYVVGELLHVQDPVLEGSSDGVLMLSFDAPVTDVSFGIALQSESSLTDAVWVQAHLGGTLQDQRWLTLLPEVVFSEARYEFLGLNIDHLQVSFAMPGSRFVFDNLSYTPVASNVPEPTAHFLSVTGLLTLGALALRTRQGA